jgi:hypothetical protein
VATTTDQEIIVLIHPTVERLRALGLTAMADTLIELQNNPEATEMPHPDWLGLLVDREITARDNRRLMRRLSNAKLRQAATTENVDYRTARGVDRSLRDDHRNQPELLAYRQELPQLHHKAHGRLVRTVSSFRQPPARAQRARSSSWPHPAAVSGAGDPTPADPA